MRREPRISVGMPVYNGDLYLELAIESILGQTFGDFELIISDNASTDGTQAICRRFAALDDRIVYSRNDENIGAARNYNRLVDMAGAGYFRWSNSDDLFAPTLHERCIEVLDSQSDVVLAYGRTKLIDDHGIEADDYDDRLDLQDERASDRFKKFHDRVGLTNAIYGLMRTDAVRRTARLGNATYPAADTNFMGELLLHGKFVEIPECLFYRRMHAAASTAVRDDEERQTSFWGRSAPGFSLPHWRANLAYLAAIRRAPVDSAEKARLTLHQLRRMYWIKRELLAEALSEGAKKARSFQASKPVRPRETGD